MVKDHGFTLQKGAFRDALDGRYISSLPTKCPCGATFSVEHALTCTTGGFTIIRHNEILDVLASLLTETCHDMHMAKWRRQRGGNSPAATVLIP